MMTQRSDEDPPAEEQRAMLGGRYKRAPFIDIGRVSSLSHLQAPRVRRDTWVTASVLRTVGVLLPLALFGAVAARSWRHPLPPSPALSHMRAVDIDEGYLQVKSAIDVAEGTHDVVSHPDGNTANAAHIPGSLWEALELRAQVVAPKMSADSLARTLNAYAVLSRQPGEQLLEVLGQRAVAVINYMSSANVATICSAYATLGKQPGANLVSALRSQATATAPSMSSHEVAKVVNAWRIFDTPPGDALLQALEQRAEDVGKWMDAQEVADVLQAYAEFGVMPGGALLETLQGRAESVVADMTAPNVANVLNAFSHLNVIPGATLLSDLGSRAVDVAPYMNAQDVAYTLNAYAMLKRRNDELFTVLSERTPTDTPRSGSTGLSSSLPTTNLESPSTGRPEGTTTDTPKTISTLPSSRTPTTTQSERGIDGSRNSTVQDSSDIVHPSNGSHTLSEPDIIQCTATNCTHTDRA